MEGTTKTSGWCSIAEKLLAYETRMKKWSSLTSFADTGQFVLFFRPLVSIEIFRPESLTANKSMSFVLPNVKVTEYPKRNNCDATKNSAARLVELFTSVIVFTIWQAERRGVPQHTQARHLRMPTEECTETRQWRRVHSAALPVWEILKFLL